MSMIFLSIFLFYLIVIVFVDGSSSPTAAPTPFPTQEQLSKGSVVGICFAIVVFFAAVSIAKIYARQYYATKEAGIAKVEFKTIETVEATP